MLGDLLASTHPNHATTTSRSATYWLILFDVAEAKLTTADAEKVFAVRQQEKMKVLGKSAENRLTAKLEASEEARELALEERTVLETLLSAAEDRTALQPQQVPQTCDAALWLLVCPWAVIDVCLRAVTVPQLGNVRLCLWLLLPDLQKQHGSAFAGSTWQRERLL